MSCTRNKYHPSPIHLPSTRSVHSSPIYPSSPSGCPAAIHRNHTPPLPFRLLDLPAEVINQIAEYTLISPDTIVIHEPRFNRHPHPPPRARSRPKYDKRVLPTPPSSRSASPACSPPPLTRYHEKRVLSPGRSCRADTVDVRRRQDSGSSGVGHTRLALLLTCRSLYYDYASVYYTANTFEFNSLDVFKKFCEAIPTRCRNQILKVSLHMPRKHRHDIAWDLLSTLRRLDWVEVWLRSAGNIREANVGEWEACESGAKACRNLRVVTIRRDGEQNDERKGEEEDRADSEETHQHDAEAEQIEAGDEPDAAEEAVEENDDQAEEDEQEDNVESVLKKDREIEGKINVWLRSRYDARKLPPRQVRMQRKDM